MKLSLKVHKCWRPNIVRR